MSIQNSLYMCFCVYVYYYSFFSCSTEFFDSSLLWKVENETPGSTQLKLQRQAPSGGHYVIDISMFFFLLVFSIYFIHGRLLLHYNLIYLRNVVIMDNLVRVDTLGNSIRIVQSLIVKSHTCDLSLACVII